MKSSDFFKLALAIVGSFRTSLAETKNIVCYHASWASRRKGEGKFTVENIDPFGCTHVIYSFLKLNEDGTVVLINPLNDTDALKCLNNLKEKNKDLKTMMAVGGWSDGSKKYSDAVSDSAKRAKFVNSSLALIRKFKFDGFDIDWEYPALRGGKAADKKNFIKLLKELRSVWDQNGLLLTSAVSSFPSNQSYDVPEISKYLDMINVMTYNMAGYDNFTGLNAPLRKSAKDRKPLISVENAINSWIQNGANPQKINLGLVFYGKSFTLTDPKNHFIGAPSSGAGNPGPILHSAGIMSYPENCQVIKKENGWNIEFNQVAQSPYAYKDNQWVSYDDPRSISEKVKFAKELNLGGVMMWTIDLDDFKGTCKQKYPLLNSIKSVLT